MAPAENFHDGELAVQRLAGLQREAGRLAGMLGEPRLDGGIRSFLADRELAVITPATTSTGCGPPRSRRPRIPSGP